MGEGIIKVIPDIMAVLPRAGFQHRDQDDNPYIIYYTFNDISFRDLVANFNDSIAQDALNNLPPAKKFSLGAMNILDLLNTDNKRLILENLDYIDGFDEYKKEIDNKLLKVLDLDYMRSFTFSDKVQRCYCKQRGSFNPYNAPSFSYKLAERYYGSFVYKFLIGGINGR